MARSGRQDNLECKVFIGDLPRDAEEREIERAFTRFGTIKSVWVARNPPGFAFVEYEDSRDAEDAVREMDGTTICGVRARVEHATGKKRRERDNGRGGGGYGGGGGGGRYRGGGGDRGSGRRSFNQDDRCYVCGASGHYAYDCPTKNGKDRGSGGRYSAKRSRSRSRSRNGRSYSRSYSR